MITQFSSEYAMVDLEEVATNTNVVQLHGSLPRGPIVVVPRIPSEVFKMAKKGKKAANVNEGSAEAEKPVKGIPENVQVYAREKQKQHQLPQSFVDKLLKCATKGEAKETLRRYLQSKVGHQN